jgi:hypothetical protein
VEQLVHKPHVVIRRIVVEVQVHFYEILQRKTIGHVPV